MLAHPKVLGPPFGRYSWYTSVSIDGVSVALVAARTGIIEAIAQPARRPVAARRPEVMEFLGANVPEPTGGLILNLFAAVVEGSGHLWDSVDRR